MKYSSLKINLEFPVESGVYHIHVWGKPDSFSQEDFLEFGDQLVDLQYNELENYYKEEHKLHLAILKQVHGNRVVNASVSKFDIPEADAFITKDDNIALTIKTADCIPILFFNIHTLSFGAIHSGWRGLDLKILNSTLERIDLENITDKKNYQFVVGPHICKEDYETSEDVYSKFSPEFSEQIKNKNKRNLNLKKILNHQFLSSGISKEQTIWLNHHTYQSSQFFSHRSGNNGRNFNIIFFKRNVV